MDSESSGGEGSGGEKRVASFARRAEWRRERLDSSEAEDLQALASHAQRAGSSGRERRERRALRKVFWTASAATASLPRVMTSAYRERRLWYSEWRDLTADSSPRRTAEQRAGMSGDGGGAARSLSDWAGVEIGMSPRSTVAGIWLVAGG